MQSTPIDWDEGSKPAKQRVSKDLSRDKESQLWSWLRDNGVRKLEERNHIQRIEDATKAGTPDVEGCIGGNCFWIELKVAYEQKTSDHIRVKTTGKQTYFAERRCKAGGRSWYLIRVGRGKRSMHYLIHGSEAAPLLDNKVSREWLTQHSAVSPNASASHIMMVAAGCL